MYKRALVALDGTPDSESVTGRVSALLAPDGEAILLHVLPDPPSFTGDALEGWLALQMEAEDYLAAVSVTGFKGAIRTFVDVGDPGDRILAIANSTKPDVVIMATHAWNGLPRVGLGRVARRLLRESVGPVLFVPPEPGSWTSGLRTILLPLEGPGWSTPDVDPILALAAGTAAEVVLLHVERPETDPLAGHRTDSPLTLAAHDRERIYREAADRLRSFGVEARSIVRQGDPVRRILEQAGELQASMIAMMSHGRRGLERLVAGSVAERVIAHSDRPVLLLRAAPEAGPADAATGETKGSKADSRGRG
jgi:nucleotide-binding universal stress UspA family protein